jgi:hypothetical protein
MFLTNQPVTLFDYLRVPYRLVSEPMDGPPEGFGGIRTDVDGTCRGLWWPVTTEETTPDVGHDAAWFLRGGAGFAPLRTDTDMRRSLGEAWEPAEALTDGEGRTVASIWRDTAGSIALPFDPGIAIMAFWSEAYLGNGRDAPAFGRRRLVDMYYRLRPIIHRDIQIRLRRAFARLQARTAFPRWPAETALHDLMCHLYSLMSEVAREPLPWIAPWPRPFSWAMVLTHDVETAEGLANIDPLLEVERGLGYRSSWNFVPRRYAVDDALVRRLQEAGCEVGVHGLYHDGRDLASPRLVAERLPQMLEFARRWGAVGFRAPATQRDPSTIASLGFEYDSSYPDTDPYEPQPGGSCSWLPYHLGDVVELPITLAQDHTLFTILQQETADVWLQKAALLRERGGMALVLTHPDYQGERRVRARYRRLLEEHAADDTAWRALPREVSDWWRRRAASHLVRDGDGEWRVEGPAASEAAIRTDAP